MENAKDTHVVPFPYESIRYSYKLHRVLLCFTDQQCKQFVRYEGATVALGIQIAGAMMLRRLIAVWHDRLIVIFIGVTTFVAWVTITAVVISQGYPVPHTPLVHSCTQINRDNPHGISSANIWILVLYDTVVIGFILARTLPFKPYRNARTIARTLAVDGVLYYLVVLAINVTYGILIIRAPNGLKNIFGQLKLHLTVAMMSRITLNLPKEHRRITGRRSRQPSRWEDATSILPTIEFTSLARRDHDGLHASSATVEMVPLKPP